MSDLKYWLGFSLIPNIGGARLAQLLSYFGSIEDAWHASEASLRQTGLTQQAITSFIQKRHELDLDVELERIEQVGAYLIHLHDQRYPENLKEIPDAPTVLYVRGTILPTDAKALSMVGTRRATRYGIDVAQRMSYWLAQNNVTVVSGLAHGIDSASHRGALKAEGRTFAVLGCGIDKVYPADQRQLSEQIIESGALISEFPLGTPPTGRNFPRRNRIISGLSKAVLVVEAPERSGAIITAEAALEQGREVFAVPANIFNPIGAGSNKLIQDGAKLIMKAQDILDELEISYQTHEVRVQTKQIVPENKTEGQILKILDFEPMHVDDIIRKTGLDAATIIASVTILELKGLAQHVGHMQYCRAR